MPSNPNSSAALPPIFQDALSQPVVMPMAPQMPPGPPPPPPSKRGAPASKAPAADSGDLFEQIKSGNLKSRLKKVKPPTPKSGLSNDGKVSSSKGPSASNEPTADQIAEERQNLTFEVLGYMQTPNGSLEDLIDKATRSSNTSRGFIYTLVRRKWVKGFRIIPAADKDFAEPCAVFPGREWTCAIELPDMHQTQLDSLYKQEDEMFVTRAHMYRFDKRSQKHVMDEIVFYKHRRWPVEEYQPFSEPEPPQDSSLENRNRWERWNRAKLAAQQSDGAQLHLVQTKLTQLDTTVTSVFQQLETTISQMREMSDAVMLAFHEIPIDRLRTFVASIPAQIKDVARNLQDTSGIIINGENLKLTPTFLESFLLNKGNAAAAAKVEAVKEQEHEAAVRRAEEEARARKRDSMVSLAGIPIHTLMPMLKGVMLNSEIRNASSEKLNRRYTYMG